MEGLWHGQVGRSPGLVLAYPISVGSLAFSMSKHKKETGLPFPI